MARGNLSISKLVDCTPEKNVVEFMERLTTEMGAEDRRFVGKLVQVGSSLEATKVGNPDEYNFNIDLIKFSCFVRPVPSAYKRFFWIQFKSSNEFHDIARDFQEFFTAKEKHLKTKYINAKFKEIVSNILNNPKFWRN